MAADLPDKAAEEAQLKANLDILGLREDKQTSRRVGVLRMGCVSVAIRRFVHSQARQGTVG